MKKILMLIDVIESGGAENILLNIARYLKEKGNYITIIPNYKIKSEYLYKLDGLNYKNLDIEKKYNLIGKIYTWFSYLIKILEHTKKDKYDIIFSFLERSNIANIIVGFFRDSKVIISVRNNLTHQYGNRNFLERFIVKNAITFFYNRTSKIITLSNAIKKDLIKNFNIKENILETIYNPYDIKVIEEKAKEDIEPRENKLFNNHDIIINIGRLTEQKGQIYLIRSFKYVIEKLPNARLVILGEGELRRILEEEIEKLNLQNYIILLGFKKNPYKYLARSKLFVFSSLWEGFGNSIVEALICKTPVISTNCKYGPAEILCEKDIKEDEKNIIYGKWGVLTPDIVLYKEEAEKKLAEAIISLLEDKKLYKYYKENAFNRALDFSREKILKRFEEVILGDN